VPAKTTAQEQLRRQDAGFVFLTTVFQASSHGPNASTQIKAEKMNEKTVSPSDVEIMVKLCLFQSRQLRAGWSKALDMQRFFCVLCSDLIDMRGGAAVKLLS
jgi:hypothetical protein